MSDLGVIALVVVAYGLVSRRLERTPVTAPIVFVAAGILLGPHAFDVVGLELTTGAGLVVAELTLVIVLFSDAARLSLPAVESNRELPARLLAFGMPLTIGLGVAAAALLLTGLELWEAAVVAAVLAPTDAALGKAVVSSGLVPARIRQALNVESGLNDGLSVPFLALFLALAVDEGGRARDWFGFAAEQIGLGALAGVGIGLAGGRLVERATRRELITGTWQQLVVLALAVVAWAVAEAVGGNGFIAAFVGGLTAGRITPACGEGILDFAEDEGELLTSAVFFIFGVGALGFLDAVTWEVVLFALLSLTVLRMLPVALSLAGTGLHPSSVAFMAWFGPRGLASIILALVVLEEEPELAGIDVILAAVAVTVLASVVAHGASARPLVRLYAREVARLPAAAPERMEVAELPTRGGLADPMSGGG